MRNNKDNDNVVRAFIGGTSKEDIIEVFSDNDSGDDIMSSNIESNKNIVRDNRNIAMDSNGKEGKVFIGGTSREEAIDLCSDDESESN